MVYRVVNVSALLPSIQQYEYEGSLNQLITKIKILTLNHSNIVLKIEDTLGTKSTGYGYGMSIELKENLHTLSYDVNAVSEKGTIMKAKLELIGAHNFRKRYRWVWNKSFWDEGIIRSIQL